MPSVQRVITLCSKLQPVLHDNCKEPEIIQVHAVSNKSDQVEVALG